MWTNVGHEKYLFIWWLFFYALWRLIFYFICQVVFTKILVNIQWMIYFQTLFSFAQFWINVNQLCFVYAKLFTASRPQNFVNLKLQLLHLLWECFDNGFTCNFSVFVTMQMNKLKLAFKEFFKNTTSTLWMCDTYKVRKIICEKN